MAITFQEAFSALTAPGGSDGEAGKGAAGRSPFRWQERLFAQLARGAIPRACE